MKSGSYLFRALNYLLLSGVACVVLVPAQTFFRAGGLSQYAGEVFYRTSTAGEWRKLESRLWLDSGCEVRTGGTGRVELLLAPGSYLRAGSNTVFQLVDTSSIDVRIALVKGSVVLEVTGPPGSIPPVVVETPRTRVRFAGRGNYRVDILAAGATEVVTSDGLAVIAARDRDVKVYPGIGARVGGGTAPPDLFGASDRAADALAVWDRERVAKLAEVNAGLLRDLTAALERAFVEPEAADGGGVSEAVESVAGVLLFDPDSGSYVLYPFGASASVVANTAVFDETYGSEFGLVYPLVLHPGYTARDWDYDRRAQDLSEPFGFRDRRARLLRRRGFVTNESLITIPFQGNPHRVPGVNIPFAARPFQLSPNGSVSRPPAIFRNSSPHAPRR